MQLRKDLVCYWIGWVAAFSLSSQGADIPVMGGPPDRARVVMAENPRATVAFEPQPKIVQSMVDHGILKLTGKADLKQAWRAFVSTQDVVGIKVYSGPGANSGTRPAVVGAVIEGLLKAGLPASHIIIWDKRLLDLRLAGFDDVARRYNVRLAGAADSGYDEKVFYDNSIMGTLVAGDLDFDRNGKTTGRNSYVSKLVTQTITKIINVSPLLNHNLAGVCGNLYTLAMGSVDNTLRFEGESGTAGDVGAGDLCEAGVERSCGVEHYRCADWTVSGRTNEFAALFDGIEPDLAEQGPGGVGRAGHPGVGSGTAGEENTAGQRQSRSLQKCVLFPGAGSGRPGEDSD